MAKFPKKYLKEHAEFWINNWHIDLTTIGLYQSNGKSIVWRPKGTAQDSKHSPSSVKHGGGGFMVLASMAATGAGSFVFHDEENCW